MYVYQKILSPVFSNKTTKDLDDESSYSIVFSIGRIERHCSFLSHLDNTINFSLITV